MNINNHLLQQGSWQYHRSLVGTYLRHAINEINSVSDRLIPSFLLIAILAVIVAAVHIIAGISFITPFKIVIAIYSGILLVITTSQSISLKSDYRHVDDNTKITSRDMIGLAVILSIVSIALICSNVYIPASLVIANLIIPILSGIYILLTSAYFVYCYVNIDRNAEYELRIIELHGKRCTYFGALGRDNKPTGKGIALSDGESQYIYRGDWVNGKCQGEGICIYKSGIKYTGQLQNGKKHGLGEIIWPNGARWVGEFQHDKMYAGKGTRIYRNGSQYIGQLQNGKKHGLGEIIWPNGVRWVGEFQHGKMHKAKGTIIYRYGSQYIGQLQNGKKHKGKGAIIYPDGSQYIGQLQNGKKHGLGKIIWPNGAWWVGKFQHDEMYKGKGTCIYRDGSTYRGRWFSGLKHGKGVFTINGNIYYGKWHYGYYPLGLTRDGYFIPDMIIVKPDL